MNDALSEVMSVAHRPLSYSLGQKAVCRQTIHLSVANPCADKPSHLSGSAAAGIDSSNPTRTGIAKSRNIVTRPIANEIEATSFFLPARARGCWCRAHRLRRRRPRCFPAGSNVSVCARALPGSPRCQESRGCRGSTLTGTKLDLSFVRFPTAYGTPIAKRTY